MISSRIQKLDTSAPGNHGHAARVAKAKRSRMPLERTWTRMMLRRMPKKVPQQNPEIHGPKRVPEHTILFKYSDSSPEETRLPDTQRHATSGSAVRQVVG